MATFNDYKYDDRQEQTFKSLCFVEANAGSVIKRLADVEADELRPFQEDRERPRKFDNRGFLFNDGDFSAGFIGIIKWTVEPNNDDPYNDYVRKFKTQEKPILIVSRKLFQSVNFIKDKLKEGIKVSAAGDFDILFASFNTIKRRYEGVLCAGNDCEVSDGVWRLKSKVAYLPLCYVFQRDTIAFECGGKERRFCRFLNLASDARVFIKSEIEIAKDILVKRAVTKDALRQSSLNRGEATKFKEFVSSWRPEQVADEIRETLGCSQEEAEKYAIEARRLIEEALEKEINEATENLENLRAEETALQERFAQMRDKLSSLEQELAECVEVSEEERRRLEREEALARQRYDETLDAQKALAQSVDDLSERKSRLEEERDALIKTNERLNQESAERVEKNKSLRQECEDLEKRKQTLWEEIIALEEENKEAQKIARELQDTSTAARLSQSDSENCNLSVNDDGKNVRKASLFTPGTIFRPLETGKFDRFPTAKILEKNLKRRVVSDCNEELAAFVLAAFERGKALILAGPCGERIVDALAAACCEGRRPGTLRCDGDWNENAVAEAEGGDDEIILVKNALNSRWVDRWPDAVAESSKRWILTTPFEEDLTLLPKGFYNYFAPVLTEMFVVDVNCEDKPLAAGKSVPRDRSNEKIKEVDFEFDGESFAKMRASAFYCKRLKATLKRAYQIGTEILKLDEASQTRLTFLFGVAPFAFATGNLDVLREAFEWEKEELDDKCRKTIRRLWGDAEK